MTQAPTVRCDMCGWRGSAVDAATHPCSALVGDLEPEIEVPDSVEPVSAWRAWRVIEWGGELRLQSMGAGGRMADVIWTPSRAMEAKCSRGKHTPPSENCSCGFYAARDRNHLTSMAYHYYNIDDKKDTVVIGKVAMWGRVIPGSQGWRAQFARPMMLIVPPSRWRVMKPLKDVYKLPTEIGSTFKKEKP